MSVMLSLIFVLLILTAMNGGLAYYLLSHDRGDREPLWALGVALIIGIAAAEVAGIVNSALVPFDGLSLSTVTIGNALLAGLVPGVAEELLKTIPLIFFVNRQPFFQEHTDGVIYFAFSGLSFGLFENIDYALRYGAGVGMSRVITLLFFHAASSGIIGFWYFRARREGTWLKFATVVAILIIAHSLYNFSLVMDASLPILGVVVYGIPLALTILLLRTFRKAVELDRQAGLSRAQ